MKPMWTALTATMSLLTFDTQADTALVSQPFVHSDALPTILAYSDFYDTRVQTVSGFLLAADGLVHRINWWGTASTAEFLIRLFARDRIMAAPAGVPFYETVVAPSAEPFLVNGGVLELTRFTAELTAPVPLLPGEIYFLSIVEHAANGRTWQWLYAPPVETLYRVGEESNWARETGLDVASRMAFELIQYDPDRDGDSVVDAEDECPDSLDVAATVKIGGCDSGVPNRLLETGCTISDKIQGLATTTKNHGQFVSEVASHISQLRKTGVLSEAQAKAIQRCAAKNNRP